MRIHVIQHVSFEAPAHILSWAKSRNCTVTVSHLYAGDELPDLAEFDLLIIMGGPMSVHDEDAFPWLLTEKEFLKEVLRSAEKGVLGICLGAQLIAECAGAEVIPAKEKEIGWFDVHVKKPVDNSFFDLFPSPLKVLHWHGETFTLPKEARLLASSEVCTNQAFQIGDRVLALQFHLEMDSFALKTICKECAEEVVVGRRFIQTGEVMLLEPPTTFAQCKDALEFILERFERLFAKN